MAGLNKEQLAGKAAYTEANKDVSDAEEWKDLNDDQKQTWIDSAALEAGDKEAEGKDESAEEAKEEAEAAQEAKEEAAVPIEIVQPLEKTQTVRDLAKAEYQKQIGGTDAEWDALSHEDVEQWESMAKMKNR